MIFMYLTMWVIWFIPICLYIIWKRGDWYLFIFPPLCINVIMIFLSFISDTVSVLFCVCIHLFLIISFIKRKKDNN